MQRMREFLVLARCARFTAQINFCSRSRNFCFLLFALDRIGLALRLEFGRALLQFCFFLFARHWVGIALGFQLGDALLQLCFFLLAGGGVLCALGLQCCADFGAAFGVIGAGGCQRCSVLCECRVDAAEQGDGSSEENSGKGVRMNVLRLILNFLPIARAKVFMAAFYCRTGRFCNLRCSVRRCMPSARAVAEMLPSKSSNTFWMCSHSSRSTECGCCGGAGVCKSGAVVNAPKFRRCRPACTDNSARRV